MEVLRKSQNPIFGSIERFFGEAKVMESLPKSPDSIFGSASVPEFLDFVDSLVHKTIHSTRCWCYRGRMGEVGQGC